VAVLPWLVLTRATPRPREKAWPCPSRSLLGVLAARPWAVVESVFWTALERASIPRDCVLLGLTPETPLQCASGAMLPEEAIWNKVFQKAFVSEGYCWQKPMRFERHSYVSSHTNVDVYTEAAFTYTSTDFLGFII
jgi:hypothetical protein